MDHKKPEDVLERSFEALKSVLRAAPIGIGVVQNRILKQVNRRISEMVGYNEDELLEKSARILYPDDDEFEFVGREKYRQIAKYGDGVVETRWQRKDGVIIDVLLSSTPVDPHDIHNRVMFTALDITERKRTEKTLKEQAVILKNILEASPVGIGYIERNVIKWCNDVLVNMFGYEKSEDVINQAERIVYPSDQEYQRVMALFSKELSRARVVDADTTFLRKDGSTFRGHIKASTVDPKDSTKGVIAAVTDDSWRERAEGKRILLETAIEQAAESVLITDKNGNIQYVNPAFTKVTGYSRDEVLGKNPRILKSGRLKDGFYQEMWSTLTAGHVWAGHFINKRKDGTLYEEDGSISPIRDGAGAITNYVAVKRDVTDEIKMGRQLLQAQKMEAIGTLAGGIAHDFNNILGAILGYTELAQLQIERGSHARSNLGQVLKAANRAKDLVRQILAFSRQTEQEDRPMLMTPIIKEALKMLRASIPSTIEIRQQIHGEPGAVMADPTEIHQVLMNLCTNAAHAMRKKGGLLEIILEDVDTDGYGRGDLAELKPGPYVRLTVKDTGEGIDPAVKDRIFDPYFTTKPKDVGTGLGLSVVHGIATARGGRVVVASALGQGATFQVYLPRLEAAVSEETEFEDQPETGTERILFVDDEEMLVMLGKQMLERLGYKVVTKSSPLDALGTFRAAPKKFDVVITDQTMPGMTGDVLAGKLMAIRPDVPIILCTGFSELIHEEKAKKLGIREFVMKPLVLRDLASAVRRALDEN
jgi:PAS domain S-box-containing protein